MAMKMSHRAHRMERRHKRARKGASLNLVSMMDIFTILVIFLLVNSSDVETLPSTKAIKLPESVSQEKPLETLVIMVNERDILVQGRLIATTASVMKSADPLIAPLEKELEYQAKRGVALQGAKNFKGEITIMGDRQIPYRLLKKIMLTCAQSNYPKISLAVLQKSEGGAT